MQAKGVAGSLARFILDYTRCCGLHAETTLYGYTLSSAAVRRISGTNFPLWAEGTVGGGNDHTGGTELDDDGELKDEGSKVLHNESEKSAVSTEEESKASAKEQAAQRVEELMAKGFSRKQAEWLSPDPDKKYRPKLSRKEAGSYGRPEIAAQFMKELEYFPQLPEDRSMYNLDTAVPEIMDVKCFEFDMMQMIREENPEMPLLEIAKAVHLEVGPATEVDTSQPVITWYYRTVMTPMSVGEEHPVNAKVKCSFLLDDMGKKHGLTESALKHIALVCGKRYSEKTGKVQLVSDSEESRQGNRDRLGRIIKDLIEEGKRFDSTRTNMHNVQQ
eukprot:jgi/Picsp_1/610/NSC_00607-R1_protein involved in high osmolarity signaling pathway